MVDVAAAAATAAVNLCLFSPSSYFSSVCVEILVVLCSVSVVRCDDSSYNGGRC